MDTNKSEKAYNYTCKGIVPKTEGKDNDINYFVEGYITNTKPDIYHDIVTEGCINDMDLQINSGNIKCDFAHEAIRKNSGINPIARIVQSEKKDNGIFVKTQLNKSHSNFTELWDSIKGGFIDAFSIAYVPAQVSYKDIGGTMHRLLEKIKLINVAFTGNPVNPSTRMTNVFMKSLDEYKDDTQKDDTMADDKNADKKDDAATTDAAEGKDQIQMKDVLTKLDAIETQLSEMKDKTETKAQDDEKDKDDKAEGKDKKEDDEKDTTAAEMKSLKTELAEVKALLEQPQFKARQDDASNAPEAKDMGGVMDAIK